MLQDNVYVPCNPLEEAVLCLLLCTQNHSKVCLHCIHPLAQSAVTMTESQLC